MKQIFVSYSRQDEAFMRRLVQALESCGIAVWYDRKGIGAGADWIQELTDALDRLDLMLLILSPDALQSQWVGKEWWTFLARGKPILPILYRAVPALPTELQRIQYFTFDEADFAGSMNRLLDELRGQGLRPSRDYVESSPPGKKSKSVDWVKWGVLITLFVGLLTVAATVAQPYITALLEQTPNATMISPTTASQTHNLVVTDTATIPPTSIASISNPSTPAGAQTSLSEPGSITLLYEGEDSLTLLLNNPAQVQRIELRSTKGSFDVFDLFDLADRVNLLAPNTCLRFVRASSSTPLPRQCDVSSTIERALAIVDVFWYDDARNLPLDLQIELDALDTSRIVQTITRVCPSSNPRCEISW